MKLTFFVQAYDGDKLIIDRTEISTDSDKAAHDVGRAVDAKLKQWSKDQADMQASQR